MAKLKTGMSQILDVVSLLSLPQSAEKHMYLHCLIKCGQCTNSGFGNSNPQLFVITIHFPEVNKSIITIY